MAATALLKADKIDPKSTYQYVQRDRLRLVKDDFNLCLIDLPVLLSQGLRLF